MISQKLARNIQIAIFDAILKTDDDGENAED